MQNTTNFVVKNNIHKFIERLWKKKWVCQRIADFVKKAWSKDCKIVNFTKVAGKNV